MTTFQINYKMLLYVSESNDPYFNLAYEEYLATNVFFKKQLPIIFLWRNQKTIVIGKNQVAQFEIDLEKAKEDSIKIVKRLSGGGTVFHDLGNFCFSFIVANEKQAGNYHYFLKPIINFLKNYKLKVEMVGKNDLAIKESKISGNAQYVTKNILVHHGTILFDANLNLIQKYLIINPIKIKTKAQRSKISKVANINDFLEKKETTEVFFKNFVDFFKNQSDAEYFNIDKNQINEISELAKKYKDFKWNFNHPANLEKFNEKRFEYGTITLWLKINKNIIEKILFEGDFLATNSHEPFLDQFIGKNFNLKVINKIINDNDIQPYFGKISKDELLSLFII